VTCRRVVVGRPFLLYTAQDTPTRTESTHDSRVCLSVRVWSLISRNTREGLGLINSAAYQALHQFTTTL
ncbi:hypothetical protein J6590_037868, partial [Homalodisca vitripennis]